MNTEWRVIILLGIEVIKTCQLIQNRKNYNDFLFDFNNYCTSARNIIIKYVPRLAGICKRIITMICANELNGLIR